MTLLVQENMTLERLLPSRELPLICAQLSVSNLQVDSRKIVAGDVFIALNAWSDSGHSGHEFIDAAIAAGAAAIIFDAPDNSFSNDGIPRIGIPRLAAEISAIAGRLYQHPSAQLPLIAITGTNGKTTCGQLLAQIFSLAGKSVGVIGTLGAGMWAANSDQPLLTKTGFTTPDAIATQCLLKHLLQAGSELVSIEVSSHALAQGRVAALKFDCAILTNLSHDHLDYHGDMKSYAAAKARLFDFDGLRAAILNIDDGFGLELAERIKVRTTSVITYSLENNAADVFTTNAIFNAHGVRAQLHTPWGTEELHSSLLGRFNLSNLLAVIAASCQQGLELTDVLALVSQLQPVAGRMQNVTVSAEQDIGVVVDFAHTPDALKNALQALRPLSNNKLICVFGCGGDRDSAKRASMGKIAAALADTVVLTSDNPRSENPEVIIAAIAAGMQGAKSVHLQTDREQAINLAIAQASAGDTVLIAGKGHECEQIFADHSIAFSDVEQAKISVRHRMANLLKATK
jgi:UDP-N-acetylmuramoyl-L-alanyl-D-glutamate--2,6-diaminopimelate ligase